MGKTFQGNLVGTGLKIAIAISRFNDTIGFNLKYGNTNATQEEIEKVAKICRIHDKIMSMQAGYNAPVGDLGAKLSGGER